jgi:dnd system-associated protein 4
MSQAQVGSESQGEVKRPKDRVRRPKDKDALLNRLVEDRMPFETFRDVLIFASALGVARNRREPFQQSSEPIPWSVFSNSGSEALINMITSVSSEDFNVLEPDRFGERLTIFEEYANGGLQIIQETLGASDRPPLDVIRELVLAEE